MMRLKLDTFTWVVIAIVAFLVVAAVVTVNLVDNRGISDAQYRTEDEPATPVYNAIVAVQRGDVATARGQFTQATLDEYKKRGYDPITNNISSYVNDRNNRRVRIVKVQQDGPDLAYVTIVEDTYSGGGLFGDTTYSNQRVIRVARVDNQWKIDDPNMFY